MRGKAKNAPYGSTLVSKDVKINLKKEKLSFCCLPAAQSTTSASTATAETGTEGVRVSPTAGTASWGHDLRLQITSSKLSICVRSNC